jgi:hypothetical protein
MNNAAGIHATSRASGYHSCLDFGGPGFKFRPGDLLSWLRFFVVFLSLSGKMPVWEFKSTHKPFLPYPVQFINHPIIGSYIASLNKSQMSKETKCTISTLCHETDGQVGLEVATGRKWRDIGVFTIYCSFYFWTGNPRAGLQPTTEISCWTTLHGT